MNACSLLPALSLLTLFAAFVAGIDCGNGYTECAPAGASHGRVPILGDGWAFFYQSLISVIPSSPDAQSKRNLDPLRSDGVEPRLTRTSSNNVFCCVASSMCVLIPSYDLPACYDKFTTNYFLSDGSHGTVSNGSYETADGGWANLVTGEYSLTDGTQGNIYANDPANAPDSNSVPVPTPFTSSGVGSAIPGSELGTVSSASATAVSSVVHTSSLATNTPPSPTDISTTWSTPGLTNSSVGTAPTGTVPGTNSGALTYMTTYPSSILPPFTSVAGLQPICCLALQILTSVLVTLLVV